MDTAKLLKQKSKSFDPSDTLRLTEIAYIAGRAFTTHLNKMEMAIRLPGLLKMDLKDPRNTPVNIATIRGMMYKGLKTCLSIRMQQRVLQMTHSEKISRAKQSCLVESLGIEGNCPADCIHCSKKHLLKQFTDLIEMANLNSRPEPYAQIVSRKLELVLIGYQSEPWLLLGFHQFPNSMFRAMMEVLRIGLKAHLTETSNFSFGALTRLEEIYRMTTRGKVFLEKNSFFRNS